MKFKYLLLSLLLAGAATANAQEKKASNIFIGANVGGMAVLNDGLNSPTFNANIMVGKYLTPTWGVRAVVGGAWQSLETQTHGYSRYCKKFVELNGDAMLNLNSLFGNKNYNRPLDVYLFAGPSLSFSNAVSRYYAGGDINITLQPGQNTITLPEVYGYNEGGLKTRIAATVGLGLAYNINNKWAVNLEGRMGFGSSIFGEGSDCKKVESTARVNLGFIYTFGGKNFATCNVDHDALNAEINKYRSELAQAQADLADCKNSLANVKPVVKEVEKEVQVVGPRAVFFKIGSAKLDDYGKVNVKLAAEIMKANPDKKYKIAGYADKATGSAKYNQKLTDKRAQVVYDALIAEGVSKGQLELVSNGGTDNMFGKNYLNRVVILE